MSYPFSFLITGGSSGIGLNLALAALRSGHKVIATARNATKARQAAPDLEKLGGSWLELDVTHSETESIVRKAVDEQGVDVLVNSAGYALLGAVEDMSDVEMLVQMETNFFGCLRTIKAVLAFLVGHPEAFPTFCPASELAPFNIRVIIVEPGAYSTNMPNALVLPAKGISKPYEGTPAHDMVRMTQNMANMKLGDPAKAAQRILEVVTCTGMASSQEVQNCLRVPLDSDCMKIARDKWPAFGKNLDAMEEIAASTAFED